MTIMRRSPTLFNEYSNAMSLYTRVQLATVMILDLIVLRAATIVLNVTYTLSQEAATASYNLVCGFPETGPRKVLIMNSISVKSGCIPYLYQPFGR
ncbi:hypothetical protein BDV27DRAFT_139299 [Aspergillus caelatus]|uniref:Uncharacterized protein n=1 Tax=Aspergillus caelatus TaxID=61420 RepID=A0A5N6ZIK0_9EURO|nr:uncharacterized protein BDV27DRAFT_139299 [Aspergillus caelatus]KAE8357457.1 hypothetical protein BDV27DRAFT_139299 [Aspergillus caelatus]